MNVSLTDELERWIETRVASGLYRSSSEVVREAVRLLREREEAKEMRRHELRQLVDAGVGDIEEGRVHDLDASLISEIKTEGRRRRSKAS